MPYCDVKDGLETRVHEYVSNVGRLSNWVFEAARRPEPHTQIRIDEFNSLRAELAKAETRLRILRECLKNNVAGHRC
jgi:hypothetical protein